ncbi:DUF2784 domain-containing protein [Amycolatopsis benzoatilytica]|uniref:DUF2784 domain-containing protein n=1 Tax=Amycolatopsis benzoatilytica TaxID=346045 RepID=UPI0003731DF8|nr:DUF2784 domain-containing protein [Amycolatopsis benzoatilytica]
MDATLAHILADATVAVHIVALAFIGFGGFLAWRWPKVIFVHVFFAFWGVLVNVTPIPCPLTALEDFFRHQQGLGDLPGGFNAYYLYGTVIPRSLLPAVVVVALTVLVISYVGAYHRWRARHHGPAHRVSLG